MKTPVPGPTPAGPYSPGIISAGRLLHVSGQGPLRDGAVITGTIETETELALRNLGSVLAAAGAGFGDVVRCGVYLADLDDFAAMNAVYERFFAAPRPARTTIGAALPQIKIEIDCVAALGE